MKVSVSIIIPTYKRKESLVRAIKSLKPQMKSDVELIIVEQGRKNLEYYKKNVTAFEKVKYIYKKTASTPVAKNLGADQAEGEILLFLDDDVIAEKNLVKSHLKNYSSRKVGGIAGRVVTPGQIVHKFPKKVGKISILGKFSDGFTSLKRQEVDTVIGCNASWRKKVFKEVHGFDERFTGNAMREESDLSLKVKERGYKIIFEPQALVKHLRVPDGGNRKTEGRFFWYYHFFSNETYFYLKHKPKLLLPLMLLTRAEWMIRCMFGFGREVSLRSINTPWLGIIDGVKKYEDWNRCRMSRN